MTMEPAYNAHLFAKNTNQESKKQILVPPRFSLPNACQETDQDTLQLPVAICKSEQVRKAGESASLDQNTLPLPVALTAPKQVWKIDRNTPYLLSLPGQISVPKPPPSREVSQTHQKNRWRRVPELRQMSAVECGACRLAMILQYYGHATSVSDVQQRCEVGRDGLSALT